MLDYIKFFIHMLYPVPIPGAPIEFARWQYGVTLTLWSLIVSVVAHIGIACGLFTSLGFSGFALAANVTDLKAIVLNSEKTTIEQTICAEQQQQAKFMTEKNYDAAQIITQQIIMHMGDYSMIVHHPYELPSCGRL